MITIKIPSKTFVCGEYLALNDGPALVLNTEPYFTVEIDVNARPNINSWAEGSPCFKYQEAHKELLENVSIKFSDPHRGQGGFGASGAQFIALVTAHHYLLGIDPPSAFSIRELLFKYSTHKQSGYDVLSQCYGGFSALEAGKQQASSLEWPFADYMYVVVRTGSKLNTHEHLSALKQQRYPQLFVISQEVINAFHNKQVEPFCESVNSYYAELKKMGYICESSLEITKELNKTMSWLLAVKACGAAGSDTIFLVHSVKDKEKTLLGLNKLALDVISCGQKAARGTHLLGSLNSTRGE